MPARPSTTRIASGPTSRTPRVGQPGRGRRRIRDIERYRMELAPESRLRRVHRLGKRRLLFCSRMLYFAPDRARPGCRSAQDIANRDQPDSQARPWQRLGMTNTRKILIVDDDAELRDALVEQLALHEEFESIAVDNGSKGVQAAKAGQVDLVIMDVGLPDVDGREAVRILRKNGFKAPIIMLTGHN